MNTRKYLTMLLSGFSVLPLLLVMIVGMFAYKQYALEEIRGNLESIAKLNAKNVSQFYSQGKAALELTANLPEVQNLLGDSNTGGSSKTFNEEQLSVSSIFRKIAEEQSSGAADAAGSYMRRSVLVDCYGKVIASDDFSLIGSSIQENPGLRPISLSEFYVSDIIQDASFNSGRKYFNISLPVYRNGVYQGFLLSSMDMYYFNSIFSEKIAETGRTLVVDSNSTIATDLFRNASGRKIDHLSQLSADRSFYQDQWQAIEWSKRPTGFFNFNENGVDKSGYYARIAGTNWAVFSEVPQSEMMVPIDTILRVFGVMMILFSAFLVLISHLAARRFLTPMHALTAAFARLKQHDYSVRLPNCYKGEFGEIASSFNQLSARIGEDTEALKVSEARYALIMEETNQVIFEWDILENHLYHTVHWTNKFGFGFTVENPGKKIPDFSQAHPEDRKKLNEFFETARLGLQPKPLDVRMRTIGSSYIWCTVSLKVIFDASGTPFRAIGLISDTDHKKKMIEKLENRTKMDLLTQLYNKMTTEAMIEEYLSSSPLEEQHGFIILDIDNFKGINDTLGHIYGDNVLKTVSEQLRNLFRATDIVGRAGGDEFVILMKDLPDRAVLKEKLNEICEVFRSVYLGENVKYRVSASVGAALFPSDGQTFEELYRHADAALYRSKKAGKDCFCLYCDNELKQTS